MSWTDSRHSVDQMTSDMDASMRLLAAIYAASYYLGALESQTCKCSLAFGEVHAQIGQPGVSQLMDGVT
jgi:hypothetical protein